MKHKTCIGRTTRSGNGGSGCVVSCCAWVAAVARFVAGLGAGLASCWVPLLAAACCLVVLAGWLAALSSCIMHDHVNGWWACSPLPHGPPSHPRPAKVIPHGTIG